MPTARPIEARSGRITLAGTLWEPDRPPHATVVMHPGSGPSTRDNDVYFPQVRAVLLAAGIAAASFDKRGVGGSTGDWREAGIPEQAGDATAALAAVSEAQATVGTEPGAIGLFGHSQGGWVVIEAAAGGAPAAFVVVNGGPGVPPAVQDRFALANAARRAGRAPESVDQVLQRYDHVVALLRAGVTAGEAAARLGPSPGADELDPYEVTADPAEWSLSRRLIDYDARPALRRLTVPMLALFGANDEITPVSASVDAFREEVRPGLLTIAVLPGGDHRVQAGDPGRLVDGYGPVLVGFITAAVTRRMGTWHDGAEGGAEPMRIGSPERAPTVQDAP